MADAKAKLPAKESNLFKHVVTYYEQKQYRKCIRTANTILRKVPTHGETLAMKGLALSHIAKKGDGKKEEAHELVRKGIAKDVRSHTSWHLYGLLHNSEQNYGEAIKCYRVALKIDKENMRILHDLSLLQVQTRDIAGYVETRSNLLQLKPTMRNYWLGLAVAYHLDKGHEMAVEIITQYQRSSDNTDVTEEDSELYMYRNMIIEEICEASGDYSRALKDLEEIAPHVLDKTSWREKRALFLHKCGRKNESADQWRELLDINNECHDYHAGLMAALGYQWDATAAAVAADAAQLPKLREMYAELQKKYPKSSACQRIPLTFTPAGDDFRKEFKTFLIPLIRKGVPSTFSSVSALYADDAKAAAIDEVVTSFYACLKKEDKFSSDMETEPPSTVMWMGLYMAQHYDRLNRTKDALAVIDEAVAHTPTVIDLFVVRARIFQHAGRKAEAAVAMDGAREMDLADRYLNTIAVRYLLRADRVEDANNVVRLFTKDTDQFNSIHEMQCIWLELEEAESHARRKNWAMALKMYDWVEKHFTTIIEDQSDFHSYCLRRTTLRAYIGMLRTADKLRGHKYYFRAATGFVHVLLALADQPKATSTSTEDPALANMTPAERKKYESKKRKEEARRKAAEEAEKEKKGKEKEAEKKEEKKQKKRFHQKKVDEDPNGEKRLEETVEPLKEAAVFAKRLLEFFPDRLESHVLAFEIYLRRDRFALCLRAALQARALAPTHPGTHKVVVRLFHAFDAKKANVNPAIVALVEGKRSTLLGGKSIAELNAAYDKEHGKSQASRVAAAQMHLLLTGNTSEAVKRASDLSSKDVNLQTCYDVVEWLTDSVKDAAAAAAYKKACLKIFPDADNFADAPKQPSGVPVPGAGKPVHPAF